MANDDNTQVESPAENEESKVKVDVEEAPVKEPTDKETEEPKEEAVESEGEPKEGDPKKETEEAETPSGDDEEAKRRNDQMAKQRIKSRRRTEQEIQKQITDNFTPKSQDDFVSEGLTEAEARVEAKLAQLDFERARDNISRLNSELSSDARRVQKEIPIFDPNSKEYDAEYARKVDAHYRRVARLQTEKLAEGQEIVVNAEEPLYDFYAEAAELYNKGASTGATQGQEAALKMMSRSEKPAQGSVNKTDTKPEDMTIEEMEAKYGVVRR